MTHASRNTTTGLAFEEYCQMKNSGIDVSKHNLYKFLASKGLDYTTVLSRKLLPDEAYYDEENQTLSIFEKKYQQTDGSADEKPQTCGFKIWEFRKIGKLLGVKPENVTYTYLLSKWFDQDKYSDMREYIRTVDGCDYIIIE